MKKDYIFISIIILSFLIALSFKLELVLHKKYFDYDDVGSYLAAFGKQKEFAEISKGKQPYGVWAKAKTWQKFLKEDNPFSFKKILNDISRFDNHPPFYFWILNVWSIIFGINYWSGPLLNLIIDILISIVLYKLAYYIFNNRLNAVFTAIIFFSSPVLLNYFYNVRHYNLFSLITILLIWRVILFTDKERKNKLMDNIILSLIVFMGAMTHYYFTIIILPAVIIYLILFKKDKKNMFFAFICIFIGYVLFYLVFPEFYLAFKNQKNNLFCPNYLYYVYNRLKLTIFILSSFLGFGNVAKYSLFICFILIILGINIFKNRNIIKIIFIWFILTIGITLFYISLLSPWLAMDYKYLSFLWPIYAFLPIIALTKMKKYSYYFLILVIIILNISSFKIYQVNMQKLRERIIPTEIFNNFNYILIDNVNRGILPALLYNVNEDKYIYAADKNYIIKNKKKIINKNKSKMLYISIIYLDMTYKEQIKKREKILDILRKNYKIKELNANIMNLGKMYILTQ